jgi:hypothetical protein
MTLVLRFFQVKVQLLRGPAGGGSGSRPVKAMVERTMLKCRRAEV